MTKYGAVRTKVDGYTFASRAEAKRYGELRLLERAGEISKIVVHPFWNVHINGMKICRIELDFAYIAEPEKSGLLVYEDVKSKPTDTALSRLKRKLLKACYGIDVEIVKAW